MDDQVAIGRCRGGDKEAFRYLVEQYQAQAIGHATAILGNREDALMANERAIQVNRRLNNQAHLISMPDGLSAGGSEKIEDGA